MKGDKRNKKQDFEQEEIHDERFSSLLSAPIFKKISNKKNKIALDDRFKGVLSDDRFRALPGDSVDQYGRKKKKSKDVDRELKDLQNLYDTNEDNQGEEEEEEAVEETKVDSKKSSQKNKSNVSTTDDMTARLDYLTKLARGEVSGSGSDDSDDSSDEGNYEDVDDEEDEEEGEVDIEDEDYTNKKSPLDVPVEEEIEYGEATRRISILNCDWENIRAQDLMMILQSFCPAGKNVKKVTVYPSDFGKERMAIEEKYGPQGIWTKTKEELETIMDEVDYEGIEVDDDEEDMGDESNEDSESDGVEESKRNSKSKKVEKGGEFNRKSGSVGLVFHDDIVLKKHQTKKANDSEDEEDSEEDNSEEDDDDDDEEEEEEADDDEDNSDIEEEEYDEGDLEDDEEDGEDNEYDEENSNKPKKQTKRETDINEIALREYELSKLRYYFAIAECDSIETANVLYEQLDDVEFENSAMVLELRFVPDEIDFAEREVRDFCLSLPSNYKPPEFVINALQHTDVKCTWDEGEKDREKKLTNFSAWRQLQDSDFAQYLASESESESEEEQVDDNSEDEDNDDGKKKKSKKAKDLRRKLLGLADDDDDEDDESDNNDDEEEVDDFFNPSNLEDDQEEDMDGDREMTFIPETGKELLEKKHAKQQQLTPLEQDLFKQKQKKKEKQELRKTQIELSIEEEKALKKKKAEEIKKVQAMIEQEELEGNDSDQEERLTKDLKAWEVEKYKQKGKKKFNKKMKQVEQEDNFQVDTSDSRFAKLFQGKDSSFGIDQTANDFKMTTNMQKILYEQKKRRHQEETNLEQSAKQQQQNKRSKSSHDDELLAPSTNVDDAITRLKKKFQSK